MDEEKMNLVTCKVQKEGSSSDSHSSADVLKRGKSSVVEAVFIVVNAALGAGLLAFPYAFYYAGGWVQGLAIQLSLLPFIVLSLLVLAYAAELYQKPSYEEVVEAVCGKLMNSVVELCVAVYCFGTCVTFLIIIGDQITDITAAFSYHNHTLSSEWWVDRRFTITIFSFLFILPWLWMRRIGVLSYTSFLGVAACAYISIVVPVKYFVTDVPEYLQHCSWSNSDLSGCSRSGLDVVEAIPFICFGYQCHISSVPIYTDMKRRNLKAYSVVVAFGILICVSVYSLTGTFGFLTFHGHTCFSSDILRNYCPTDIAVDIARGMLILCVMTSYPILHFCGRTAVDSIVMKLLNCCRCCKGMKTWVGTRLRVEALLWFLGSLLLALFVPQIAYVIRPIGGLAATFIFVFPGIILLKLFGLRRPFFKWKTLLALGTSVLLIVIGTFILGNSVTYSILKDFNIIK